MAQQLRMMAGNWEESKAGRTPVTDSLRGAVKLRPDFDERVALTEELQKKRLSSTSQPVSNTLTISGSVLAVC